MTTRGFCACCGMPECIIDGTDGRECFHCGVDAPMPVDEVAAAVAAERARCAAVCRARAEKHRKTAAEETAAAEYGEALESGVTAREADACAEAIERGAVER